MRKLPLGIVSAAASVVLLASSAHAADLPARVAPQAPLLAAVPVFTWTGFYAGVNAGYGWETRDNTTALGNNSSSGGFVGGGQVGYNYQFVPGAGVVVGLETDLQYAGIEADTNTSLPGYSDRDGGSDASYFGTVRARLGYAFDRFLVYGTGGFAYGDVGNRSVVYSAIPGSAIALRNKGGTDTGWVVGAGVEYAFTSNLTAKLEGLYVSLGTGDRTAVAPAVPASYNLAKGREEFGVVRAGLNYKF